LTVDVPGFTPEDEPDEIRLAQWHLETLQLATAHELTRGAGVTVALVDTGVDATHPDLHGNVLPGIDLVDRDKDNAWTPEANGTALAGLIVGHGNRLFDHEPGNRGVLGVAPEASLLPVRAVDPDLSASENIDLAVEGIIWAATHGADVIVYASGTASRERFAPALDAVREAGAVLVSAVGDRPQISAIGYPAADESVIAVAGHDRDGALAEVSLTGPEVDIAAPAVDVTTTGLRHGYGEGSSTSVAAAIVAGATALVRARYPDLPPEEVVHRIVATATDAGPVGEDEGYGAGMLNVVEALTADVPPLPRPPDRGSPLDVSLPVAAAVLAVVVVTLLSAVFLVVGGIRARRRRRAAAQVATVPGPAPWPEDAMPTPPGVAFPPDPRTGTFPEDPGTGRP